MADLTTLLSKFLNDLYAGTLGVTMPISKVLVGDGTAAAPALAFTSEPTSGWYRNGSNDIRLSIGGTARYVFNASGLFFRNDTFALTFGASDDVSLSRGAADVLQLASGDKFAFGGVTNSFPLIKANGNNLSIRLADDSAAAQVDLGGIRIGSTLLISGNAPTVSSAGTSPSVTASNGTAAFRVNVGTGGTATTIVMAMPAATTGWNCHVENLTGTAANRANQRVVQTASTTTSITVQNQTISTGAALAFTASDIVAFICTAY